MAAPGIADNTEIPVKKRPELFESLFCGNFIFGIRPCSSLLAQGCEICFVDPHIPFLFAQVLKVIPLDIDVFRGILLYVGIGIESFFPAEFFEDLDLYTIEFHFFMVITLTTACMGNWTIVPFLVRIITFFWYPNPGNRARRRTPDDFSRTPHTTCEGSFSDTRTSSFLIFSCSTSCTSSRSRMGRDRSDRPFSQFV